jgi:hypothetical protein
MAGGESDEIKESNKKLDAIKNRDENIREAYKLRCAADPNKTKDGVCQDIADRTGLHKATIWNVVTFRSVYEKKDISTL